MQSRLASSLAASLLAGAAALTVSTAAAVAEEDPGAAPAGDAGDASDASSDDGALPGREKTHVGLGLRLRNVRVPQGLIEVFVERAAGGSSETGFGLEISRRRGDFEVQFGLEWDKIEIQDGVWVDKGDTLPQDEPDFVTFDGFGWVTAEVSFLNHTELAKQFSLRYGGGAGIGVLLGEISRTDYRCTSADFDSCGPYGGAENVDAPYEIPPVMLVVNAIFGVQIRPVDSVFINLEGGLRTLPYFGGTVGYYF